MSLTRFKVHQIIRGINPFLAVLALILGLLFALYPRFFSMEYGEISQKSYVQLEPQLGQGSKNFLKNNLGKKFENPKDFLKSIPSNIPEKDRNLIIDIFNYRMNFTQAHSTILLALFIIIVVGFVAREWSSGRKYAIAHSIRFLHKSIHHIREHWDEIFHKTTGGIELNQGVAEKYLTQSLHEAERYFSTISGAPCRVCIKVFIDSGIFPKHFPDNADICVETLARSSKSKSHKKDKEDDYISRNSEFLAIAKDQKAYYYKRNVDIGPYLNSHIEDYTTGKKNSDQLDYRCTFTFGIRSREGTDKTLHGFLCIDSKVTDAFKPRHDAQAGFLLADFFSLFLKKYRAIGTLSSKGVNDE